jgi:predicted ATPase
MINPISLVDYNLLAKQKSLLMSIREELLSPEQHDALRGVIHLIDAIQDYAVDALGHEESEVFNLEIEDV